MYKKILISLLLMLSIALGNELEPHCFENDFMLLNNKMKIEKVKIYLQDSSRKDEEEIKYSRLFYTLENGHTYVIEDLLCSYDENTSNYSCGIECDGGFLEYDTKNHVMYMEDLRSYEGGSILPPDWVANSNDIERVDNPEKGWLSTGMLEHKDLDTSEKVWVYERNCTTVEEPKTTQVYYSEDEYLSAFPTKEKRDEYFDEFYQPLTDTKDFDTGVLKTIKLKKSYRTIARMMKEEGFDLSLFEDWLISLFIYNNKRAFIHLGSPPLKVEPISSYGVSYGYYLLELNGRDLKVRSFGWESGDIAVVTPFEG